MMLNGLRCRFNSNDQSRRAIICLHHGTGSTNAWQNFVERSLSGYYVCAYDRRGFGESQPLQTVDLHKDFLLQSVDELLSLLDSLELDKVCLIGHSDGAAIALMCAALVPDRVACIVAEAPHLEIGKHFDRLQSGFDLFERTVGMDPRYVRAMERDHSDQWRDLESRWKRYWRSEDNRDWDEMHIAQSVLCPVLIVHGEKDPFWPVSHSEDIANAVGSSCELHVVLGADHSIHHGKTAEFSQIVNPFLRTHWAASGSMPGHASTNSGHEPTRSGL
jgi:pimeloyl-ACP methyl ester carboxylesterase